jgi:glutamine amidotransferase
VIAVVDYGAGNLTSVLKALAAVGADVCVARDPRAIAEAAAVVVPGVGHFQATSSLGEAWRDAILARLGEGRPLLGICLGMQWLFEASREAPGIAGLGLFSGTCEPLPAAVKVPHVGWNSIERARGRSRLLEDVADGAQFYFTHSFAGPVTQDCAATTTHGTTFASVVERGQVFGVQFHPEKSGEAGLRVLGNFVAQAGGPDKGRPTGTSNANS